MVIIIMNGKTSAKPASAVGAQPAEDEGLGDGDEGLRHHDRGGRAGELQQAAADRARSAGDGTRTAAPEFVCICTLSRCAGLSPDKTPRVALAFRHDRQRTPARQAHRPGRERPRHRHRMALPAGRPHRLAPPQSRLCRGAGDDRRTAHLRRQDDRAGAAAGRGLLRPPDRASSTTSSIPTVSSSCSSRSSSRPEAGAAAWPRPSRAGGLH